MIEKTQEKRIGRPFEKGNHASPGRPKGSKSIEADLREMFLEALDLAGGVDYLRSKAKTNPNAFLSALARMLPQSMKVETDFKVSFPDLPSGAVGVEARKKLLENRISALTKGGNGDGNGNGN